MDLHHLQQIGRSNKNWLRIGIYWRSGKNGPKYHIWKPGGNSQNFLNFHSMYKILQWGAYSFSLLFVLDVATKSQKDHKAFSATYNLCSKKMDNKKIEGTIKL